MLKKKILVIEVTVKNIVNNTDLFKFVFKL